MLKKAEKGGTRPAHRASMKNCTSMAVLSTEARDAGQATVPSHLLQLVASAGRTLSMASWLSTRDRPTAGSMAGGGLAEDSGFFPFSDQFNAMAMERAELESEWERKLRFE